MPRPTIPITRWPTYRAPAWSRPRNVPSIRNIASPCTAEQAKNVTPGRRSRRRAPAPTSPSSAAPSSWKGAGPPSPSLSGLAALRGSSEAEETAPREVMPPDPSPGGQVCRASLDTPSRVALSNHGLATDEREAKRTALRHTYDIGRAKLISTGTVIFRNLSIPELICIMIRDDGERGGDSWHDATRSL